MGNPYQYAILIATSEGNFRTYQINSSFCSTYLRPLRALFKVGVLFRDFLCSSNVWGMVGTRRQSRRTQASRSKPWPIEGHFKTISINLWTAPVLSRRLMANNSKAINGLILSLMMAIQGKSKCIPSSLFIFTWWLGPGRPRDNLGVRRPAAPARVRPQSELGWGTETSGDRW